MRVTMMACLGSKYTLTFSGEYIYATLEIFDAAGKQPRRMIEARRRQNGKTNKQKQKNASDSEEELVIKRFVRK